MHTVGLEPKTSHSTLLIQGEGVVFELEIIGKIHVFDHRSFLKLCVSYEFEIISPLLSIVVKHGCL